MNKSSTEFVNKSSSECVNKSAEYLRDEIFEYFETLKPLNWPPSIEELTSNKRNFPPLLITFVSELITSKKQCTK